MTVVPQSTLICRGATTTVLLDEDLRGITIGATPAPLNEMDQRGQALLRVQIMLNANMRTWRASGDSILSLLRGRLIDFLFRLDLEAQ